MRPKSIVRFEQLYLLAIAIEVARTVIDWPFLMQAAAPDGWIRVAAIVASALLVWLAARRRQRWAAVILGALFVIGLPMIGTVLQPNVPAETTAIIVVEVLLQAVALLFLLAPASRAWFAGTHVGEGGPGAPDA